MARSSAVLLLLLALTACARSQRDPVGAASLQPDFPNIRFTMPPCNIYFYRLFLQDMGGGNKALVSFLFFPQTTDKFNRAESYNLEITFTKPTTLYTTQSQVYWKPPEGVFSSAPLLVNETSTPGETEVKTYTIRKFRSFPEIPDTQDVPSSVKTVILVVNLFLKDPQRHVDVARVRLDGIPVCEGGLDYGVRSGGSNWPWLAAIFHRETDEEDSIRFKCGGSLVSERHVLTAAHCLVNSDYTPLDGRSLSVFLGEQSLHNLHRQDQGMQVSRTVVHPDYRQHVNGKDDADIGLVVLSRPVMFSDYVRHIGFGYSMFKSLNFGTDLEPYLAPKSLATVVGWGCDQSAQTAYVVPRDTNLTVVGHEQCLQSDQCFNTLVTNRTVCAANRNGSAPCIEDSGSNLYSLHSPSGDTPRFYLTGIVSRPQNREHCDYRKFSVFTKVDEFTEWIWREVTNPRI